MPEIASLIECHQMWSALEIHARARREHFEREIASEILSSGQITSIRTGQFVAALLPDGSVDISPRL